ncbi:hypothetical protein [Streptomyces sp. NPDC093094]|uniref:hypothetical protein n=1 Tax=Streptomyces sp. NPDC093094 TaxID=3366026 RepID=UPI0038265E0C
MSVGVPLASGKSEIFEALLKFMPDWVQITVLALVILAVLASWAVKLKRRIDRRRALRSGAPVPVPAQRSGADHLGPYAPQAQAPQPQSPQAPAPQGQPSGADFLGSYAPPQTRQDGTA